MGAGNRQCVDGVRLSPVERWFGTLHWVIKGVAKFSGILGGSDWFTRTNEGHRGVQNEL